jgi:hypothetical protein
VENVVASADVSNMTMMRRKSHVSLSCANNVVGCHFLHSHSKGFAMTPHEEWNEGLVKETIGVLQKTRESVDDAIDRLQCYLRHNPGWPTIPPARR